MTPSISVRVKSGAFEGTGSARVLDKALAPDNNTINIVETASSFPFVFIFSPPFLILALFFESEIDCF